MENEKHVVRLLKTEQEIIDTITNNESNFESDNHQHKTATMQSAEEILNLNSSRYYDLSLKSKNNPRSKLTTSPNNNKNLQADVVKTPVNNINYNIGSSTTKESNNAIHDIDSKNCISPRIEPTITTCELEVVTASTENSVEKTCSQESDQLIIKVFIWSVF